jgi:N-methylhydantoinase B
MSAIDPVDLGVWWTRIIAFTAEAATTLKRAAFSPVVTESNDFAVALFSPEAELVAQPDVGFAAFTGCLTRSVPRMLASVSGDLAPGDVLVTNDPWVGASQLNDYIFLRPVFHRGRLVAYATCVAHSQDVGGSGLLAADTREVYTEGIQVPVVKFMERGVLNTGLLELILRNVRLSDIVSGDFFAQISANDVMATRLGELLDGEPTLDCGELFTEILARSELAMRAAVDRVADGQWHATGIADGLDAAIIVNVELAIRGSGIVVDFAGTSEQSGYSFNCTKNFAIGRALAPIIAALSPGGYINGGSFRNIEFRVPVGCIFDPAYPAAIGARGQSSGLIAAVILRALASCLPDVVPAESNSPVWAPVIVTGAADGARTRMLLLNGGTGAAPVADGSSCMGFPDSVCSVRPETLEGELPIAVLAQEFVPDSGGRGQFRGGLTQRFVFRWEGNEAMQLSLRTEHVNYPPEGLAGGLSGTPGQILWNGVEVSNPKSVLSVKPGDVVELRPPGGGGHGDPALRASWRIAEDVSDGTVSSWPECVDAAGVDL